MHHISVSQINMFGRCPEQWRRRYLERDIFPPGIATHVGSGVHFAAEVNDRPKIESGEDQPLDVLTDAAAEKYEQKIKDGVFIPREQRASASEDIAKGKDRAVALTKVFANVIAPLRQPAYVEERVELEVEGLPVHFLGILDCLSADGVLDDLKTSGRKWNQGRADHELQPTLYRQLVKQLTGLPPRAITFDVLVAGKRLAAQRVVTTRNDEDFAVLVQRARLMIAQVDAGIFPPAQPGAWICSQKWCGYWWSCPHIPPHKKTLPPAGV
jgi:hypothetical protein